ncbi:MAG: hypothetical protein ACOY5F_03710 [Pseudomonadota bacterium]
MRSPIPLAAVLCLIGAGAAAESVRFDELEGLTIEANWIEDLTFRPLKDKKPRTVRSPRQVTLNFGPGGAIQHKLIRTAGPHSRTDNRQMTIDRQQPSGLGFVRWAFEDGRLVYIETLLSGARRLTVSLDRKDGKLTCAISAQVAREGNKPVLTISLAIAEKVELLDVKVSGGDCTVTR